MIRTSWTPAQPGQKPTVKQMWREYAKAVGVPFGGVQWKETEQAFFAGVYALLAAQWHVAALPEEEAAAWMEERKNECEAHARGRAEEMGLVLNPEGKPA